MPEPDAEEDLSQLELPSLFRRRKKKKPEPEPRVVEPEASPASEDDETPAPEAAEQPSEVEQQPSASEGASVETPATDPAPPPPEVEQQPSASEGAPVETPTPDTEPADVSLTASLEEAPAEDEPVADDSEPTATWEPASEETHAPAATEADVQAEPAEPAAPAEPKGPSRATLLLQRLADVRLPPLPGHLAAASTGAITGLIGVVLVLLAQALAQAVRGTSNAGAGGVLLVLGIIALSVAIGAGLLRAWGQTGTLSVSFLGVGLVVVLTMLFLIPVIFSWAMIIVIPVLGAGTFALSWWVSNRLGPEAQSANDEYSRESHR